MDEHRYVKRKEKALLEGNRENLAICCKHLGDFYNQQGKYERAVKEYEHEAEIYARLGKPMELAKAHRMVGEMYMLLCDFTKAKEHINLYLKTAKSQKNKVEEQRAYVTLGRAYLLQGQSATDESDREPFRQAEKAFLKSLLLIKDLPGQISKLEQLDMQARCYLNIGVVKEQMGNYDQSVEYIEKAIKICKAHDIFELTHLCYISMSLLYHLKVNEPTLALRYCNMALEVAKRLPNRVKKICETLLTKSEILIKEGDFASAKQILTKAYKKNTPDENDRKSIEKSLRIVVKICQTLDELVTTSLIDYEKRKGLYERLGDACCHLQSYSKALEYYQEMLECAELNCEPPKNLIPIYVSLYQTFKDNRQYDKALEFLWKEHELNKDIPAESCTTLCSIGEICEMQNQPFWNVHSIYLRAKEDAAKSGVMREKLERVVFARLMKLQQLHKMDALLEELQAEAKERGININDLHDDDSDAEVDGVNFEQNTPEVGDDVCLEDLTDSDMSDLDETEKPRPHRATRGTRCLTIKRNNKGETQLHQACIAGNLELVRRLLDQGHVTNVRDHAGWIPLHEACNHGYRDIAALLLDRGAAVAINDKGGTSCDGITPLYDACVNGYFDVIELLLERGADATVKTDFGETCVDGLDKWRKSVVLSHGEQLRYEELRSELLKPLASAKNMSPLTNENVKLNEEQSKSSDEDTPIQRRCRQVNRRSSGNRLSDSIRKENRLSSPRKQSAMSGLEYKNVMENVKHPNRATAQLDDELYSASVPSSSKAKRNAFLDTEEVDDDSWLDDDIGPEKKKRRYHMSANDLRFSTGPDGITPGKSFSKENLQETTSASSWDQLDLLGSAKNAYQLLREGSSGGGGGGNVTSKQRPKSRQRLSLSRTSSMSSTSSSLSLSLSSKPKAKHQSSLIDKGFCRFRSESPIDSDDSLLGTCTISKFKATIEPDSTTSPSIHLLISPGKSSPIKVQGAQVLTTTVSFKVKVEDELLLVPVERRKLNDINIRWLAEEAARRYYNLVGVKPALRLKTPDGFAYQDTDPVAVALEQTTLLATVTDWMLSPLGQRYEEMCCQLNKEKNPEAFAALERAQATHALELGDLWLTPPLTEPIFRSLLRQSDLRILDLSHNFIQNEGCRQLAKSLPTLTHLNVLNLKGNMIEYEGLEVLFNSIANDECPELEEMNLSQNPLGNEGLRVLHKFYSNNPTGRPLRKLSVAQCDLTNFYDFDLCYYQMQKFDVSFNQLTMESLRKLLSQLNASGLEYLNISYTQMRPSDDDVVATTTSRADLIVSFFESGTCMQFKHIELSGCQISDYHLHRILLCLRNANNLQLLNIADNDKISGSGLGHLIDKVPHLRKLLATNCPWLVDEIGLEKLSLMRPLPSVMSLTMTKDVAVKVEHETRLRDLWQAFWGQRAKVISSDNNIILTVNDEDYVNYH